MKCITYYVGAFSGRIYLNPKNTTSSGIMINIFEVDVYTWIKDMFPDYIIIKL